MGLLEPESLCGVGWEGMERIREVGEEESLTEDEWERHEEHKEYIHKMG